MAFVNAVKPSAPIDDRRWYKYTRRRTGLLVLKQKSLRWSTPGTLNDPFDNQFNLHIKIDRNALRAAILQRQWETYSGQYQEPPGNLVGVVLTMLRDRVPGLMRDRFDQEMMNGVEAAISLAEVNLPKMHDQLKADQSRFKMLCLSETSKSTLMWSHYAEDHQGLVLQFKCTPGFDSIWPAGQRIQYLANMPRLLDSEFLADTLSGRLELNVPQILRRLVFTKSNEWSYEQEWRIWSGLGRNLEAPYEDCQFNGEDLDAVIFGCRMPQEDRNNFSTVVRQLYPSAQLLEAVKNVGGYGMDIRPM